MAGGEPFGEYNKDCQISGSQDDILAHSHFARQDDFPSPFNSGIDWPELSSSSAASSPSAVVPITICSAPETPETHQADGGDTTPQAEYKTPPEVAAPTSASSDDAVSVGRNAGAGRTDDSPDLGFSGGGESPNRKRKRDEAYELSPSTKKLKDSNDLGFQESTREVRGTVVLVSDDDDDDEVEEERENVEQARIGGDTEVINDLDERKETEKGKFEVRAEMNEKGRFKVQLNLETNSDSKENGLNLIKCLLDALRNLSGDDQEEGKDEPDDIFETAKQRGMTFPRSRWYDRD